MNELISGMPALRRLVVSADMAEHAERWRLADLHTGLQATSALKTLELEATDCRVDSAPSSEAPGINPVTPWMPSGSGGALAGLNHLLLTDSTVPLAFVAALKHLPQLMSLGLRRLDVILTPTVRGEGLLEDAIAAITSLRCLILGEALRDLVYAQHSLVLEHGCLEEVHIGEPHLGAVAFACPRLRICDLECKEADITMAPLLHCLAEGSPLLETLRIRARAVLMGSGCPTAQTLADIVLAFPLLCDLDLHQTALADGHSVPGFAHDRGDSDDFITANASASFPAGFAPVLGSLGLTGFRHIDAVVNDLVRRCTRMLSLTLHRCPGSLHFSAPIPTLRALDVGGMELAHDDGPSTAIAKATVPNLEWQGLTLSHIAPSASILRLQHVRCSRGVLLVERSSHLRQLRLFECPLSSLAVRHAPMLTTITITSVARCAWLSLSIEACPSLRVLKLEGAWVAEDELQAVVAACPVLTELEVRFALPLL
jgi:hypothetical protein